MFTTNISGLNYTAKERMQAVHELEGNEDICQLEGSDIKMEATITVRLYAIYLRSKVLEPIFESFDDFHEWFDEKYPRFPVEMAPKTSSIALHAYKICGELSVLDRKGILKPLSKVISESKYPDDSLLKLIGYMSMLGDAEEGHWVFEPISNGWKRYDLPTHLERELAQRIIASLFKE